MSSRSFSSLLVKALAVTVAAAGAVVAAPGSASAAPALLDVQAFLLTDGTAPFSSADGGGEDSADDNQRVRTQDTVTYRVDYSVNPPAGTFEEISHPKVTVEIPAGFALGGNPPAGSCPGGMSRAAAPGGGTLFTCNLGTFNTPAVEPPNGSDSLTGSFNLSVFVPMDVASGTNLTFEAIIADEGGSDSSSPPPVVVTSKAEVDIFKANCWDTCNGGLPEPAEVPGFGTGFILEFGLGVRSPRGADARGLAAMEEPIVLADDVRIPNGDGTDGTSHYPVGPGQPGLTLMDCNGAANGHEGRWPLNGDIGPYGPPREVDPMVINCEQPNGKGTAPIIEFSGVNWARAAAPPTLTRNGQNSNTAVSGILGFGRIRYFISHEDWLAIGADRNALQEIEAPGGVRTIGGVTLGDRLVGVDDPAAENPNPILPANSGTCPGTTINPDTNAVTGGSPGTVAGGWTYPDGLANLDDNSPSTIDPDAVGGASNYGADVESAENNVACLTWRINPPVVSSGAIGTAFKFAVDINTTAGPAVAPDAQIPTGMRFQNVTTMRNPEDVDNPDLSLPVGSIICDKWDNSRFGPVGPDWISAIPRANPSEDFLAEYGATGYHIEYGVGFWGTHNANQSNAYYWQGRSRCEDTGTDVSGAPASTPNNVSALLEVAPGDYWATPGQVDFTNSGLGLVDIDDVNVMRIVLDKPVDAMLPSERATYAVDGISDADPVTRDVRAEFRLDWQNKPGIAVPTHMRNYGQAYFGRPGALVWVNGSATGTNDTTDTSTVTVPCGAPCGQQVGVGTLGLWWQVLGAGVAVQKDWYDPVTNTNITNGSVLANTGDDVVWRLRGWGTPPAGTPADAVGTTADVTFQDELPAGMEYLPGTTVSVGAVTVGEPEILVDTPSAGRTTLRWQVPSLPWSNLAGSPFDVRIRVTTDPFTDGRNYINTLRADAPSIDQGGPGNYYRFDQRNVVAPTPAGGSTAVIDKQVTPNALKKNTPFQYKLLFANKSATAFDTFDAIDILPWNADSDNNRRSTFDDGAIQFLGVDLTNAHGVSAWASAVNPETLDAADAEESNRPNPAVDGYLESNGADPVGGGQWPCTIAQVVDLLCPAIPSLDDVTALRFIGNGDPFLEAGSGPFTIGLNYTTTGLAKPGDLYDNGWVARFGDLTFAVYKGIPVPPQYYPPLIDIDKKSGPSADGPWAEETEIAQGGEGFWKVTLTNTGRNPLVNVQLTDEVTAACAEPEPALPDTLAPGASFTWTCSAGEITGDLTNTIGVTAEDEDENPVADEDPARIINIAPRYALGNLVWDDPDNDGLFEDGENPIPGVVLELLDADGDVLDTTTTDENGRYVFDNLLAGTYRVRITAANFGAGQPLTGYRSSTPTFTTEGVDNNDDGAPDGNGGITSGSVTLGDGDEPTGETPDSETSVEDTHDDLTVDFGVVMPASIGDFVWEDSDGDGLQEENEPPIPGVVVHLYKVGDDEEPLGTTETDEEGFYEFDDLDPGDYYLVFEDPEGYEPTKPNQGTAEDDGVDSDPVDGQTTPTTLIAGEHDPTWDAGFYRPASLGDYVWFDYDKDGVQDAWEPPVAGVTVELLDDEGVVIDTTTTDEDGFYEFTELAPGSYAVRFVPPPGRSLTTKDQGSSDTADAFDSDVDPQTRTTPETTLVSGEHDPTLDAGILPRFDLWIQKSVLGSTVVKAGGLVRYQLDVGNAGDPALGPIQVQDVLPAGLQLVRVRGGAGWTCTALLRIDTVKCRRPGPLAGGTKTSRIVIVAKVDPKVRTRAVVNTASVTSPYTGDIRTPNGKDPARIRVIAVDPSGGVLPGAGVRTSWSRFSAW